MVNLACLSLDGNVRLADWSGTFKYILTIPSLQQISAARCDRIHCFADVGNSSLKSLVFSSSDFLPDFPVFCALRELKELFLDGSFNSYNTAPLCPVQVQSLHLEHNNLNSFPTTCNGNVSLFPSLESLYLSHNRIGALHCSAICLPMFKSLDTAGNLLTVLQPQMFSSKNFQTY